jgi:hypothetical protein
MQQLAWGEADRPGGSVIILSFRGSSNFIMIMISALTRRMSENFFGTNAYSRLMPETVEQVAMHYARLFCASDCFA